MESLRRTHIQPVARSYLDVRQTADSRRHRDSKIIGISKATDRLHGNGQVAALDGRAAAAFITTYDGGSMLKTSGSVDEDGVSGDSCAQVAHRSSKC